jgi:hypothetical protein
MPPNPLERAREGTIFEAYCDLLGAVLLSFGTEAKRFKSARSHHGDVRTVGITDGTCAATPATARQVCVEGGQHRLGDQCHLPSLHAPPG